MKAFKEWFAEQKEEEPSESTEKWAFSVGELESPESLRSDDKLVATFDMPEPDAEELDNEQENSDDDDDNNEEPEEEACDEDMAEEDMPDFQEKDYSVIVFRNGKVSDVFYDGTEGVPEEVAAAAGDVKTLWHPDIDEQTEAWKSVVVNSDGSFASFAD